MTPSLTRLTQESLALPREERAQLLALLVASLHELEPEHEALWIQECQRRMAEFDAGRMEVYSAEEVLRNLETED